MRNKMSKNEKCKKAREIQDAISRAKRLIFDLELDIGETFVSQSIYKGLECIEYTAHLLHNEQLDSVDIRKKIKL
ncbi:MAG: hypothetical protein GY757_18985 [bacterium]|nr:hypothetical protein [bacterium]